MARMIPPVFDPTNPSDGERKVFELLRDDPATKSWVALHSQDVARFHVRQVLGEVDFVILIPSKGVLCLEIKGHKKVRRQGGAWYLGNDAPNYRGPFKQALEGANSIRKWVVQRRNDLGKTPFVWAVIFPFVSQVQRFETDEWHPWQLITADDLKASRIGNVLTTVIDRGRDHLAKVESAKWFHPGDNALTGAQRDALTKLLRPDFELCETPASARDRRADELRHYTEEQFVALDAMETNERVLFEGPAGTGKTVLALEDARREAIDGRSIVLLCFNHLLASELKQQVASFGVTFKLATLHSLMAEIANAPTHSEPGPSQKYWEEELPARALEVLLGQASQWEYDVLIIDEAQDVVRGPYLDVLECLVRGGWRDGRWRLFGDFDHQALYGNPQPGLTELDSRAPGVPRYSLRVNCRNTPRIMEFVHLLARPEPGYTRALRPDTGVDPKLEYYSSADSQLRMLEGTLCQLLADGYAENEIVVLSPRANSCAAQVTTGRLAPLLQPLTIPQQQDKVGYGTVHAFKGLDRPAVVLTDVDDILSRYAQSLFYTGISRATDRLTILVDERARDQVIEALTRTRQAYLG